MSEMLTSITQCSNISIVFQANNTNNETYHTSNLPFTNKENSNFHLKNMNKGTNQC